MGTVWKALHLRFKRHVALKLLRESRLRDPDALVRFHREMEALGRLNHPNLVRAHDAGEAEGQHFLVMEFVDGTDVSRLVRSRGPLRVTDACEIVRQAAIGLSYAHQHGLVHRDIKPSNLMLTQSGTVKVLDLGLARLLDEGMQSGDLPSADRGGVGICLPGYDDDRLSCGGHAFAWPGQLQYEIPLRRRGDATSLGPTDAFGLFPTQCLGTLEMWLELRLTKLSSKS